MLLQELDQFVLILDHVAAKVLRMRRRINRFGLEIYLGTNGWENQEETADTCRSVFFK